MKKKVSFGFSDVDSDKKDPLVQGVFSDVASKYDLMNDVMSFFMHRSWKKKLMTHLSYTKNKHLLDLAGGTGDIAASFVKNGGRATALDLNAQMIEVGKEKYAKDNITWCHASAEQIPFDDESFDYCTISFGIRNVTNISLVLSEALRVLKPGGSFLCMEFSKVHTPILKRIYDFYIHRIIPKAGKIFAKNEDAYRYLAESIARFDDAKKLKRRMQNAGFCFITYELLLEGVVAIHKGFKT